jgi:hypothetical protein
MVCIGGGGVEEMGKRERMGTWEKEVLGRGAPTRFWWREWRRALGLVCAREEVEGERRWRWLTGLCRDGGMEEEVVAPGWWTGSQPPPKIKF